MNLLQIGSYLYPDAPGGAEISAQNVALALEDRGHRIVRMRWLASASKRYSGAVSRVSDAQWAVTTWRPYSPLATSSGLSKAVFYGMELTAPVDVAGLTELNDIEKIDAVIVHSFRGMGYDLIRKVASLGLPTVIFLHDFALICLNKGMYRHGGACEELCWECKSVAGINRASLRDLKSLTIIGPSKQMLEKTRRALSLENATYEHVPNPNTYKLRPRKRVRPKAFTLGYIGRLEADKGVRGFLEVVNSLRHSHNVRVVIAGDGTLAANVSEFARTREWVDYLGYVDPADIVNVYDQIDIIAMPSLWAENFPGVLVQALGNGIPAVGFDIGGIPEILCHGETGLLARPADFSAMEAAFQELMETPEMFERMSVNSLLAYSRFEPASLKRRVVGLIERAMRYDGVLSVE